MENLNKIFNYSRLTYLDPKQNTRNKAFIELVEQNKITEGQYIMFNGQKITFSDKKNSGIKGLQQCVTRMFKYENPIEDITMDKIITFLEKFQSIFGNSPDVVFNKPLFGIKFTVPQSFKDPRYQELEDLVTYQVQLMMLNGVGKRKQMELTVLLLRKFLEESKKLSSSQVTDDELLRIKTINCLLGMYSAGLKSPLNKNKQNHFLCYMDDFIKIIKKKITCDFDKENFLEKLLIFNVKAEKCLRNDLILYSFLPSGKKDFTGTISRICSPFEKIFCKINSILNFKECENFVKKIIRSLPLEALKNPKKTKDQKNVDQKSANEKTIKEKTQDLAIAKEKTMKEKTMKEKTIKEKTKDLAIANEKTIKEKTLKEKTKDKPSAMATGKSLSSL